MIMKYFSFLCSLLVFIVFFFLQHEKDFSRNEKEEGHALDAFDYWYNQRADARGVISKTAYLRAVQYVRTTMLKENSVKDKVNDNSQWVSIGPDNVGGRTLSIAVNPEVGNIVWAGSSSGGLWKSTTGGIGSNAWAQVSTGYPTMAISSIVINPHKPDEMYIGTGEVGGGYKYRQIGTPGARATYGMGVLKSVDAGATWTLTGLVWQFSEIAAIQKLVLNPLNPNTIFAATTEGIYKSVDAGESWTKIFNELMAMDIVINQSDTTILYSAHGQSNTTANPGLYKTTDAGQTWALLSGGLPAANFGRTTLAISSSHPEIVYASIANASSGALLGLYKTTDDGSTWSLKPAPGYLGNQGWYDNVVAVHPDDPNVVFCSGLDIYRSWNGGTDWTKQSYWYAGAMYDIPAGGPEGPPYYVHADHHVITFDPSNPNRMYFGCDGGIFFSSNLGETFSGVNGGYVTTQFYNGFALSETDSLIAMGGLQDNGTVKYEGAKSWSKVFGGDGGWCAIDPRNPDTLYEEYVNLIMSKSTNGGYNWFSLDNGFFGDIGANFISPFVIAPSDPRTLYAGASIVYKGYDGGSFWDIPSAPTSFNNTSVATIGVSYQSADSLIAGTGGRFSGTQPKYEIFVSSNGALDWARAGGTLPKRYPTDISFDPGSSSTAYITFSGYDTTHVYKTTNLGTSWIDISSNLPDIPVQCLVVDPAYRDQIYIGTDLGVFRTLDGGASWHQYDKGMPPAMVIDLAISKSTRKLRAATHGHGIFERQLPYVPATVQLNYRDRWNLFSLPLKVSDARTTSLFPSASSQSYTFQGSYTSEETLQNGKGYFVKLSSAGEKFFSGSPLYRDTIDVKKGWNMIGSITDSVDVASIETIPSDILNPNCYSFDGGYQLAGSIQPGLGYWMKASQAGKIILASKGNSKRTSYGTTTDNIASRLNSLTITDAAGNKQTLYFGSEIGAISNRDQFELPPVPPAGVFDVRFTSQFLTETYSRIISESKEFQISLQSVSYPLKISWNISETASEIYQLSDHQKYNVILNSRLKEIIVDKPLHTLTLTVGGSADMPRQFVLEQNYPNPFNPSTTIRYQLPQTSRVLIRVFDILGKNITTLVDKIETSGNKEIEWDGKDQANQPVTSGIYFYDCRFLPETGEKGLHFTRKMILMK